MRTVGIQAWENAQGQAAAGPVQTEQYTNPARRRLLLQRFWRSTAGFWRAEEDRRSWTLSAIIMLTVLLSLAASIGMNYWNRAISVAHRPELEAFHDRKITLERHEGGARLISDIHLNHEPARGSFLKRWFG